MNTLTLFNAIGDERRKRWSRYQKQPPKKRNLNQALSRSYFNFCKTRTGQALQESQEGTTPIRTAENAVAEDTGLANAAVIHKQEIPIALKEDATTVELSDIKPGTAKEEIPGNKKVKTLELTND